MVNTVTSTFTWLDYSERDRRRALDVIDLFRETGTVDELGVGTIRDAFADTFFPGTSTIQTRACYFLLLPWTFLRLERLRVPSTEIDRRARTEELNLNEVLLRGSDTDGVFGSSAGRELKRLPSAAYWGGLGTWGILLFPGHMDAYFRSLSGFYRRLALEAGASSDPEGRSDSYANWHPHVPEPPKRFPFEASVSLRRGDSEYLRDRILARHSGTLLAVLAERAEDGDLEVDWPWELSEARWIPPPVHEQLKQARLFAIAMNGAAFLYNLMLAEARSRPDWIDTYRAQLAEWADEADDLVEEFRRWDLRELWQMVGRGRGLVAIPTQAFVQEWIDLIRRHGASSVWAERSPARKLILDREFRLKSGRARLHYRRHLELWSGASGASRMEYRWSSTKRILEDIFDGLRRGRGDARDA
jgi:hypothetical protein